MRVLMHLLGKDVRRKIVEMAVRNYGVTDLASMIGVSKAAITKYVRGSTHPSDEVMERLLNVLDENLLSKALVLIIEEFVEAMVDFKEFIEKTGCEERLYGAIEELKKTAEDLWSVCVTM